jgi:PAS domain S-box-containing protein
MSSTATFAGEYWQSASAETTRLLASADWAATPLGQCGQWPVGLQVLVDTILESKTPMLVAWGPELTIIYNEAYGRMLADKHPWAFGRPYAAVWPERWEQLQPLLRRVLDGEAVEVESGFRLLRQGKPEDAWFQVTYTPVRGDGGEVQGLLAVVAERTYEKELESSLQESEANLRAMADAMPQMVWGATPDGQWDYYNQRWCELAGRASNEMQPDTWMELLQEDDRARVVAEWQHSVATGEPFDTEFRVCDRAGQCRWLLARALPVRTDDGAFGRWWGTCTDINEQRLVQEQLQDARLRLEATLEATEIGTWVLDLRTDKVYADPNMAKLYGISEADANGGPSAAYFANVHPDDAPVIRASAERCLLTGEPYTAEYRVRRPDGSWRQIHARGKLERDEHGRPAWLPGIALDVTQQRQAEEALREMDRRKDEFLAMLAHELRNPLAPIATGATILKRVKQEPERVVHFADMIDRQARHMSELVNDLLDVSRISRGLVAIDTAPVDVAALAREALEQVHPFAFDKHHQLVSVLPPQPLCVEGDHKRLVQVLVNLLQNAVKFTPAGGLVHLEVSADAGHVRVKVRDNGPGMDGELLEGCFEMFRQGARSTDRARGGLGIGLALVKSLVEMHGGTVTARSDGAGKGSEFEVVLPRMGSAEGHPA